MVSSVTAQDYCKSVVKEVSPDKKIYEYTSPTNPEEVEAIKVSRSINVDPDYEADNFILIFQVAGDLESIYTKGPNGQQLEKEEWKLSVTFDDKSTLADETVKVTYDFTPDKLQSIRQVYYTLNDAAIKDFSTKKVAKFSLAATEKTLSPEYATAVMHYVECIKKAK